MSKCLNVLNRLGLVLITSCLFWFTAHAQLGKYKLTRITEAEGLPANRVHQIHVDRLGYIWVGTINGLSRYDGYTFKRFYDNPNDSTTIRGLIIWKIFEDRDGLIWVGAGPEFLNAYDPATGKFKQFQFKHLIKRPANVEIGIMAMSQDKNGRMYFGVTSNYGEELQDCLLYKDYGSDSLKVFKDQDGLVMNNISGLETDSAGNTWILTYSGLFNLSPSGKLTRLQPPKQLNLKQGENSADINIDTEGNLWMLTSIGDLLSIQFKENKIERFSTPYPSPPSFLNNRMLITDKEKILLATTSGLNSFNRKTKQFEQYPPQQFASSGFPGLSSIAKDKFGTIWTGSISLGLFKLEERAHFTSYTPNNSKPTYVPQGWASRIKESGNGQLWFPSNSDALSAGINKLDLRTGEVQNISFASIAPGLNFVSTFDILPDGDLVLVTNIGIRRFHPADLSIHPYAIPGYSEQRYINDFYTDSRKNSWLGTMVGPYRKAPGATNYVKYDMTRLPNVNASSEEISFLYESKKHGLWMLSNNGLYLYRYDVDSIERHGYDRSKGDVFVTQDINAICEDNSGAVWVGTWQGGLSKYDPEKRTIKTYTRDDGLPSMSIQSILLDEKTGTLWLSTFDGLCRFDPKTGQSFNYTIDDNIQGLLFADGACLRSSTGQFFFGGANGLTTFHPDEISGQSDPPLVYLTAIKVFNKPLIEDENGPLKQAVHETKEITLAYNQNSLSLEFIALHYANPEKNRYAYQLENYDPEWREVTGQREAFYSKLPPGKYVFKVKAANNNGVWNEEGVRLAITILPPWWQSPLAFALYALGAIGLGLLFNRFMKQRLLNREREKNRLRELDHAREIEKAYRQLEESHETLKATQTQLIQSEKMASLGELTAGIAHEIQNPLNFVNNFSELNKDLLQEMKQEMDKGNHTDAHALAEDIIANEEKIALHGKRAETIVKNMLLHSRTVAGEKQATDINALADEYFRLAYHGLRAKDKRFNATLKTDYASDLPQVSIVPQDIGRVLLNLCNNAFHAVQEKRKTAGPGYEPTVTVTTKRNQHPESGMQNSEWIAISIQDNGPGIPDSIRDKIFQPFFTTKAAGQGTGLGLSLSYDIVKAHGGEIQVDSKPGESTRFTVVLPIG